MENIEFHHEDISEIAFNKEDIKEKIRNLIQIENKIPGNINIIFCSDQYILEVNKKYLNHDYFTDIITFDYVEGNTISGDLFISKDRISENANTFAVDFFEELKRVIFHGILHLVGYGDKTSAEKMRMTEKENFYLKKK